MDQESFKLCPTKQEKKKKTESIMETKCGTLYERKKKEIAINMPDASEAIGTPACME